MTTTSELHMLTAQRIAAALRNDMDLSVLLKAVDAQDAAVKAMADLDEALVRYECAKRQPPVRPAGFGSGVGCEKERENKLA